MDVSAKQRLFYHVVSLPFACSYPVLRHVISTVVLLRIMKVGSFWKPFVALLIATPFCLLFALLFGGGGHGTYFPAKVLFPYTMLSALLLGTITTPFILLSIVQFPIYGFALGVANKKDWFVPVAGFILLLHFTALILCFMMTSENF